MRGGLHSGVGGEQPEHLVAEKGVDENEYDGDAHAPEEGVAHRLADHAGPLHSYIFSGQGFAGESESVREVGEEKQELQHDGA